MVRGFEGRSTRGADRSLNIVGWIKEHGISERELCCEAEVDRRTWRRASGRPYPSDRNGVSLLTIRDFFAVCAALDRDPIEILKAAQIAATHPLPSTTETK